MNHEGVPYRAEAPVRKRVPVPDSAMQNGMNTGMLTYGLPTPSPETATSAWQTQDFSAALSAPVSQSPQEQMATGERSPYLSPRRSGQFGQPSVSPSRSPNMHLRNPSQLDTILQENATLRHELDEIRAERDQTQAACDSMLTELMNTQETLQEREMELSRREQFSHQQNSPAQDGNSLSRNDEKELRDLRLRCNRLQSECRRKDGEFRQAQTQSSMYQNMHGQSPSSAQHNRELSDAHKRFMDAEASANHAAHLHHTAQAQADKYAKQLHEWSTAYDGLKASYTDLHNSHTQLLSSSAVEKTRSREDDETKAKLDDVKKMRDFFQQNSEKVAKKNIEVAEQMRRLQDALHARTMEFEQQKAILEALQG